MKFKNWQSSLKGIPGGFGGRMAALAGAMGVALALCSCAGGADYRSPGPKTILTHANLIPMTGLQVLKDRCVVIGEGRIEKICGAESVQRNPEDVVIDCGGGYVLPGLVDMHVHFVDRNELSLFVANGITTVRNTGEFPDPALQPESLHRLAYYETTPKLRDRVEKGEILGPRMMLAGHLLDGDPPISRETSTPVTSVDQVKDIVRREKEAGYDYIKVYFNVPRDIFFEIVKCAKQDGMKVIGHVPFSITLEEALDTMHTIEHLTGYYDYNTVGARIARYAELTRRKGVWNCPTLVALKHMLPEDDPQMIAFAGDRNWRYLAPSTREFVLSYYYFAAKKYATNPGAAGYFMDYFMYGLVRPLKAAGAGLLVGTDSPFSIPGFSYHDELALLVASGLTPYQALRAATVNAAECLGTSARQGTIEAGRNADLVLLKENPLEDIARTRGIQGVMLRGVWHDRKALDGMLERAAGAGRDRDFSRVRFEPPRAAPVTARFSPRDP